jgi:hypothetical protein
MFSKAEMELFDAKFDYMDEGQVRRGEEESARSVARPGL